MPRNFTKFTALYSTTSIVVFNLVLMFLVLNVLSYGALQFRDYLKIHGGDAIPNNPWELRKEVYPDLNEEEIYTLFMETWEWRDFEYSPISQYREAPFKGRFVNVTAHGFRRGRHDLPWPPDPDSLNVFVFGGSTTFGYGVADADTVPSYLSSVLQSKLDRKVAVYNFGRTAFYSTQEGLEFQRLLMAGRRPDLAIFIDGLNEFFYDTDALGWTERLSVLVSSDKETLWSQGVRFLRKLPLWELTEYALSRISSSASTHQRAAQANVEKIITGGSPEASEKVLNRYLDNKAFIEVLGNHYGVDVAFVWQPSPAYKYDLQYHAFAYRDFGRHADTGKGYEMARQNFSRSSSARDIIWCADIQIDVKTPLYVDAVHYNADLSKRLAHCIGDAVSSRLGKQS